MSDIEPGELDYHIARTTWLEADQQARLDYIAATKRLQQQFEYDTLPYRDAYVNAERATWDAYRLTIKTNWRMYQNKLTSPSAEAAAEIHAVHRRLTIEPLTCGERPYPAGSEGDDGTQCVLPLGHDGLHSDDPTDPRMERNPQ